MTARGKAQNFRAHGNKFSYVRKYFFLRTEIFFSYVRKFPRLRTSIFCLPQSTKFSCARKKISFRKKIYFLAEEKIFSCGRKFGRLPNGNLGVFRTEILRPAEGEKFPSAGKEISAYAKIFFRIYGNKFSYIRKFSSVYTAFFLPAQAGAERGPWKGNFPPRAGRKRRSSLARRWD